MARTTPRDDTQLLAECQKVLGYHFRDVTLLREALTHASGANHRLVSNERLEFLGDAILGAVVCDLLFRKFPDYLEGDLTQITNPDGSLTATGSNLYLAVPISGVAWIKRMFNFVVPEANAIPAPIRNRFC